MEGGAGPFGGMGARPRLPKYSCTCLGISAKTCLASSAGDFYGKERNNTKLQSITVWRSSGKCSCNLSNTTRGVLTPIMVQRSDIKATVTVVTSFVFSSYMKNGFEKFYVFVIYDVLLQFLVITLLWKKLPPCESRLLQYINTFKTGLTFLNSR